MALDQAGDRTRGATMYVTLEPCNHHGKTPPCADAIRAASIARVVYACADPDPIAGGGAARLADDGLDVHGGVAEVAARDLNARFFHLHGGPADRPWIELKLALSLDARIADHAGGAAWITGEQARAETHRLRAHHDAVMVGVGTVLADDPLLTVRGPVTPRRPTVRVVLDRQLRLPTESRLVDSIEQAPVWVLCEPDAPDARRAELAAAGVRVLHSESLRDGLRLLRAEGVESVFCEGGAAVASALLAEDLVDRLTLVYAPILLGPRGGGPFEGIASPTLDVIERWRTIRSEQFGADTLVSLARAPVIPAYAGITGRVLGERARIADS
jgi:diaminohydroxyphosphoribosylaminopyrimidine deaminase/5-amino-6-(5-phosphoribosylamino)uracil reductase